MKKTLFALLGLFLTVNLSAQEKYDKFKMELVTQEILINFVEGASEPLKKYISHEWLEKNSINVNEKFINNYAPKYYKIIFTKDNNVIAKIGSDELEWAHLLLFAFTIEDGVYRLIPKGLSQIDNEFIDPWFEVSEYICNFDSNSEMFPDW